VIQWRPAFHRGGAECRARPPADRDSPPANDGAIDRGLAAGHSAAIRRNAHVGWVRRRPATALTKYILFASPAIPPSPIETSPATCGVSPGAGRRNLIEGSVQRSGDAGASIQIIDGTTGGHSGPRHRRFVRRSSGAQDSWQEHAMRFAQVTPSGNKRQRAANQRAPAISSRALDHTPNDRSDYIRRYPISSRHAWTSTYSCYAARRGLRPQQATSVDRLLGISDTKPAREPRDSIIGNNIRRPYRAIL